MVRARSRLILAVTLSVGTLHPQGVESTQKISHVINVQATLRLTAPPRSTTPSSSTTRQVQ